MHVIEVFRIWFPRPTDECDETVMTVVTVEGLLPLLQRIEFVGCSGDCQSTGPCPECGNDKWDKHKPGCELRSVIEQLEKTS